MTASSSKEGPLAMTASHVGTVPRFRGVAASRRSLHVAAAAILLVLVALAVAGVVIPITPIAFLAAGAGAGYSLSGSV